MLTTAATFIGYYSWNWGSGSVGPSNANVGISFTGLVDLDAALSSYPTTGTHPWCCPELRGEKMMTLGGGNSAGTFNVKNLDAITGNISAVKAYNYSGIVFDVEQVDGSSISVGAAFERCFAAAKDHSLKVVITTSHSAPYQCDSPRDAVSLVKGWVASKNVDVLSPQLYSSGRESSPEFATTTSCSPECGWELYDGFKGIFAPSIVDATQYNDVVSYFARNQSLHVGGFIAWKQTS